MSFALHIPVKESLSELKRLHKTASLLIRPRVKMLIEMKKAGQAGISKRALMDVVGASSQSIHTWRTNYKNGGIDLLVAHNKKGFKPSVFTSQEQLKIAAVLRNPQNGLQGYKELQQWVKEEFNKQVKYNTLLKYCILHFKAHSKVARKSHIKKDEQAVATFKKTSAGSAKKPSKQKTRTTKK